MPDQVTQVQPEGGNGSGFGPGLIMGIIVIVLLIIAAFFFYGMPGRDNTVAPDDGGTEINNFEVPDGGNNGGVELPSEVDVNVDTPQQ